MKEPKKIPLNLDTQTKKEPQKIPLPPLKKHLYDDFGYVMSIEEKNNEDNSKSN